MNTENMKVLTNVIGAVESGGQIYGKRRYDAYAPAYYNTPNEHTCTLGWAQNYGPEARKLVQMIYDKDPTAFKKIDANGSIQNRLKTDWVATRWNPNAADKAKLIRLIDSKVGHEAQDQLFAELMNKFIADCARDYTNDIKAQMMYCEIRHLGGKGPVDRIFKRCKGNYSLTNIMAALNQDDPNSNQVGSRKFRSRHQKCVEFINKYAVEESTSYYDPQKVISIAESWVGYLEKKNGNLTYLKDKTANAGSANYTWFGYTMHQVYPKTMDYPAAWCDAFVDYCFYDAYGKEAAMKLLCGEFDDYTVASADKYKVKGQWHTSNPIRGDQIFFKNDKRICHTGLVYKVDSSTVYTIEGNTSGASDVIPNGGGVCKKAYSLKYDRIAGYGRPKYGNPSGGSYMFELKTIKKGDTGPDVYLLQEIFRARGYKMSNGKDISLTKKFGDQTEYVLKWYQKQRNLTVDGICGPKTWQDLLAL